MQDFFQAISRDSLNVARMLKVVETTLARGIKEPVAKEMAAKETVTKGTVTKEPPPLSTEAVLRGRAISRINSRS